MFGFINKVFVLAMSFFSWNALKCVLMNNRQCKIRPKIININNNEPLFYLYSIIANECNGICNDISHACTKLCVSDVAKNISDMKLVSVNVVSVQVFVIINNVVVTM